MVKTKATKKKRDWATKQILRSNQAKRRNLKFIFQVHTEVATKAARVR